MTAQHEARFVEELLPALTSNARAWARRHRLYREVRDDMVAEIIAHAWQQYCSAVRNGHDVHAGHLWWVAIRRYRGGRPFAGRSRSRDVCSAHVMRETGHELVYLDHLDDAQENAEENADQVLAASRRGRMPDPSEHAAARIDLAAFKRQLDGIEPAVLDCRIAGYLSREIARALKQPATAIYLACARLQRRANQFFVQPA